jgi:hypothetical protein
VSYAQVLMEYRLSQPALREEMRPGPVSHSCEEYVDRWSAEDCRLTLEGLEQTNRSPPACVPDRALYIATGEAWIGLLRARLSRERKS